MRAWCALLVAAACHGGGRPPADAGPPAVVASPGPPAPVRHDPPARPAFPAGTRSLQLVRTVGVHLAPGDDAKRIGTIAIDTRVGWTATARAQGCDKPWVEIRPRGWICGSYVEPSDKPPDGLEVPRLDPGEIVPGVYGKVTAKGATTYRLERPHGKHRHAGPVTSPRDSGDDGEMVADAPVVGALTVRRYDEVTVGGKAYWKIDPRANAYVLASQIHVDAPSRFAGTRLGDDTGLGLPIGFVWPHGGGRSARATTAAGGGSPGRRLAARTPVTVLETARDAAGAPTAYRIGDGEWLAVGDVHVFHAAPPPAELAPNERWIDVDLDAQILVAYEGALPVYATLVSSGAKATPTETGLYRMWMKESEADMKGLGGEDPYSVATVPWTQFFSPVKGLALHTAYWHDEFGHPLSHGCINLAPRDARWLYFWSDPQVPPGWTMTQGVVEAPGSLVRVRSAADPDPEPKGYEKHVRELREATAFVPWR